MSRLQHKQYPFTPIEPGIPPNIITVVHNWDHREAVNYKNTMTILEQAYLARPNVTNWEAFMSFRAQKAREYYANPIYYKHFYDEHRTDLDAKSRVLFTEARLADEAETAYAFKKQRIQDYVDTVLHGEGTITVLKKITRDDSKALGVRATTWREELMARLDKWVPPEYQVDVSRELKKRNKL